MKRGTLLSGVLLSGVLLAGLCYWPGPARAAFVMTNGLDSKKLRQRQVTVALVQVRSERVDPKRKARGYALHRWLDLRVVRRLHGPQPPTPGLRNVPYSPFVNSAWPIIKGPLKGRYFIMAWIKGYPCGLGMTVTLGPRIRLPVLVSGPRDPRVAAVSQLMGIVRSAKAKRLVPVLKKMFLQAKPIAARAADSALVKLDRRHKNSHFRYRRLLGLVSTSAGADPWLSWSVLADLGKFPAILSAGAFRRWRGKGSKRTSRRDYLAFRKRVQKRLIAIARQPKANPDLRVIALWQLLRSPSYVGLPRGAVNRVSIAALRRLRTDPQLKVRKAAKLALGLLARRGRRRRIRAVRRSRRRP